MSFLLFEIRNQPIELTEEAVKQVITRLDRDYPPYVKQLPCILDVHSRKTYQGPEECTEYLAQFQPPPPPPPPPTPIAPKVIVEEKPAVEDAKEDKPIEEEPKKKVVRRRTTKTTLSA